MSREIDDLKNEVQGLQSKNAELEEALEDAYTHAEQKEENENNL